MKKLFLLMILGMTFFSKSSKAVELVDYYYDQSQYTITGNMLFKFKLKDWKPSNKITANCFWDIDLLMFDKSISPTIINNGTGPKEDWNTILLENLPTGIYYFIELSLNGEKFIRSIQTPGKETYFLGPNISFVPKDKSLTLQWLANATILELKFLIGSSQDLNIINAQTIIEIPYDSIKLKKVAEKKYTDYFLQSFVGDKLYCKVYYKVMFEKNGHWEELDTLLELRSFSTKETATIFNIKENPINIFPNPCTNSINIESILNGDLNLYDMFGQKIWSQQIVQGKNLLEFDIPKGMYTIVATNNTTTVQKIIFIK